jgi:hypothetical protein
MATKSLGVTIDRQLTFDQHVANVCKTCYVHIRALRHVRESLPDDIARIAAYSVVKSKFDYCNSVHSKDRLQLESFAARAEYLCTSCAACCAANYRATPVVVKMYWLPVR